jgi:hypothetical protein
MRKPSAFLFVVPLILLLPRGSEAQEHARLYLNAGYVTNLQKCDACDKADTGFSVRVGLLRTGRLGFYAGYLRFKEYNVPTTGYDDEGKLIIAGVDLRLLETGPVDWYAKFGLASEEFISTYYNGRTESETNIKPDIGLLLNISHFNALLAWQPSEPSHFNVGIGITG